MPTVHAAGRSLNCEWVGDGGQGGATLVFLHEGLGSIRQWRDFPSKLCSATGLRGLVFDRYGYGQSDILEERTRDVHFMHDEALRALPDLLSRLNIGNPVLVGHSDGASIALIHAGGGFKVKAVVAMAPHVFIEPVCISSIRKIAATFETGDLPKALGKYHRDARRTFYGWADVWLDPDFESWDIRDDYLPRIECPVLAIQGEDDEYGTMAQLDDTKARVKDCELLKLPGCGHTPFRDQPEKVLLAVKEFLEKVR
jgi:pimeloyl-ACP methyl ester carboxylesterase